MQRSEKKREPIEVMLREINRTKTRLRGARFVRDIEITTASP
jgi:hypothetical protein